MRDMSLNNSGKQKIRKKQTVLCAKIEILAMIIIQSLAYFLYYYENLISGFLDDILLPIICFFFGAIINIGLVASFHSHILFIILHVLLTQISMLGAANFYAGEQNDQYLHNKLFMSLIQFSCILIARIPYQNYKQTGLIYACLFIIFCIYQKLLFISFVDMLFTAGFMIWSSWATWKYLRILDEIVEFEAIIPGKKVEKEINDFKQKLQIQDYVLMEGISDCIFFTQLQKDYSKLIFHQVNQRFNLTFNTKQVGIENILAKMKVQNKDIIIKVQRKIFKLMDGLQKSKFDLFEQIINSKKISLIQNQNAGSLGQLNQNEQQRQYLNQNQSPYDIGSQNECGEDGEKNQDQYMQNNDRKSRFIYDNKKSTKLQMNGLEYNFWQLDQLRLCVERIKQQREIDPNFQLGSISEDKYVEYFNMQDILFVILFGLHFQDKNSEESDSQMTFKRKMNDLEVVHENTSYNVQLFKCLYQSKDSIFFTMNKKMSYITNEKNNITDIVTQRMFQFYQNRTEKIQKSVTSLLCKFDCIRNFQSAEAQIDKFNNVIQQFEYIRMNMKDTEEYRELLQEQQGNNLNGRNKEIKIQQQNITQFKFQQLYDDIDRIFNSEVSFKSTQIYYKEIYKPIKKQKNLQNSQTISNLMLNNKDYILPDDDENKILQTDYDKLKRILIQLVENSLSHQKAGIIEIEVKELNQNTIRVMIKDNQNTLNKNEIKNINENGYSEKGFGFAIVNELLKTLKPKSIANPLKIKEDTVNDKMIIYFWIAKNLIDEYQNVQNLSHTNLSHFANMNSTHQEIQNDQRDKRQIETSNASYQQQKFIEQLIKRNQNQLIDGSQYVNRHISQKQLNSHLNSPGKVPKFYSEIYRQLRENLNSIPNPSNFLNFYFRITTSPTKTLQNGDQNHNVGQNHIVQNTLQDTINNNNQNNNKNNQKLNNNIFNQNNQYNQLFNNLSTQGNYKKGKKPSFLIVSCDFRVSNSLYTLIAQMCGNEESVKFASNKNNFKELLQTNLFEYILIDQLDGFQIFDIFETINLKYKHQKKNQKIIFFGYNSNIKRNFEHEYPLFQCNQNFNDSKSDAQLQPYFLPQFHNQNFNFEDLQNQEQDYVNQEFNQNQSQNDQQQIKQNKNNITQEQRNRSSRDSSLERSIPNEQQNNQNKNYPSDKMFEFTTARSNKMINDQEVDKTQLSNFNLMSQPKKQLQDKQMSSPKRSSQTNSPGMNALSKVNGIYQVNRQTELNGITEVNNGYSKNKVLQMNGATQMNGLPSTYNSNQKNLSQQKASIQYDEININEGYKNTQIIQDDQQYKTMQPTQLTQKTHPIIGGLDSEQNSTNRNRTPSIGPIEAKVNQNNISQNKKSPPTHPKRSPNMLNHGGKIRNSFMRQESQKNQRYFKYHDNEDRSYGQGFMQGSFPHTKQYESIEVEQCLKFFYYTLQHPFGYAQIYEAIYLLNLKKNFSNQNFTFFNLNTPDFYQL